MGTKSRQWVGVGGVGMRKEFCLWGGFLKKYESSGLNKS